MRFSLNMTVLTLLAFLASILATTTDTTITDTTSNIPQTSITKSSSTATTGTSSGSSFSGVNAATSAALPLVRDKYTGLWYANVTVGSRKNVHLAIDTSNGLVAVNPHVYERSDFAKDLNTTKLVSYGNRGVSCSTETLLCYTFNDTVALGSFTFNQQGIFNGVTTPSSIYRHKNASFPINGSIGFTNGTYGNTSFIHNICDVGMIESCRFGLALGPAGKEQLIVGYLDRTISLKNGPDLPEAVKLSGDIEWKLDGNVFVDGQSVHMEDNAGSAFLLQSASPNIIGPKGQVSTLFDKLGWTPIEEPLPGCVASIIIGQYPCSHQPEVGFRFSLDSLQPILTISPSALGVITKDKKTCNSTIVGMDMTDDKTWILGEPWFRGKYVDFDVQNRTIIAASLQDDDDVSGTTTTATGPSTATFAGSSTSTSTQTTSSSLTATTLTTSTSKETNTHTNV